MPRPPWATRWPNGCGPGSMPRASTSVSAIVVLICLTAVQLIVGELVPKALALQYPTEVALATVLPLEWSLAVFRPVIAVLNGGGHVSPASVRRGRGRTPAPPFAGGDRSAHCGKPRGGLLEPAEQARLRRALHLGMRTARDLMVPRAALTMLDVDGALGRGRQDRRGQPVQPHSRSFATRPIGSWASCA